MAMPRKLACIILAAGKGARMKSALPKPLHKVAGRSMVGHVIAAAEALSPEKIVVVAGPGMEEMAAAVRPHPVAIQQTPDGTGGAAKAAHEHFKGFDGDILIVYGDSPLITADTLKRLVDARRQTPSVGLVYSGVRLAEPGKYGRMVMDDDGTLKKIVEFKDATPAERDITLCNGGFICADGAKLFGWLDQVTNDNAAKEYYITDLPQIARRDNRTTHIVEIDAAEMAGANDRAELAALELMMQKRLRNRHMLNGVTLPDPDSVFFSHDTVAGQDVVIGQSVVFGPGVVIAGGAEILPFSHIEGAEIGANAKVGPFARIRPGTKIGADVKVGNFVETKKAFIGDGAKISHLSYIGDAEVGEDANIGAGTITCNYDGFNKHNTVIGKGAFIGSNTALVAPVTVGAGAIIGAGSTITKDVPADALAVSRTQQSVLEQWAARFRDKMKGKK
jgi:bifunctional UDP-N-acetylglucosamine pyrophosphorylase/glucosamine-1-phosphate N-acetyltransferase